MIVRTEARYIGFFPIHFTITGLKISFVIPGSSLFSGSLYWGSSVVGCDQQFTIRKTTLATRQLKTGFMWLEMWAFREIFFQGNKEVEANSSVCNQFKYQVNHARHEVTSG